MSFAFPEPRAARPVWLITLADLALLLVGFFVLLQANQKLGGPALARGFRAAFASSAEAPPPIALAAGDMTGFAPGSAVLPQSPQALVAWTHAAARDPRVALRVTGYAAGGADTDPVTGSANILAADRARAVAAALLGAGAVAPNRLTIATAEARRRAVLVTVGFTGPAEDHRP